MAQAAAPPISKRGSAQVPALVARRLLADIPEPEALEVATVVRIEIKPEDRMPLSMIDLVEQLRIPPLIYRDGRWRRSWPSYIWGFLWIRFSSPFGWTATALSSLPEIQALPEAHPSLKRCAYRIGGFNPFVNWVLLPLLLPVVLLLGRRAHPLVARILFYWGLRPFSRAPHGVAIRAEARAASGRRALELQTADEYGATAHAVLAAMAQVLEAPPAPGVHLMGSLLDPVRFEKDMVGGTWLRFEDPWSAKPSDLRAETPDDRLRAAARFAILAPSGHNTQPWKLRVDPPRLEIHADRARSLPVVDPGDRELTLSCGAAAAFAHLALAGSGQGATVSFEEEPSQPDRLATLTLSGARDPSPSDLALLEAITERHTHRGPLESRPIDPELLASVEARAHSEGCWLVALSDTPRKRALAELIAEGDEIQLKDPAFRRELAEWIRPNSSRRGDGLPGYAFGVSDLPSRFGARVLRTFNLGKSQAEKDRRLVERCPTLLVLGTQPDERSELLSAGYTLGLVLLELTAHGVRACFLSQPCEIPALRQRLKRLLETEGCPQIVLRIGYGEKARATPRRPIEEVLTSVGSPGSRASEPLVVAKPRREGLI